jgi:UDP-N-acetyl-D-mannosaminuronic acid dehydrogenase
MNIYVFGLGHIGLPIACWISLSGKYVHGIDNNPDIINQITNGSISIEEYYEDIHISELAKKLIDDNKMHVFTEYNRLEQTNAVFIVTVGIADRPDGSKDISPILSVIENIKSSLVANDLIIIRSTLIPGTCENIIIPLIKETGLPFYFSYCPETIIETQAFDELEKNQYIIGAMDQESFELTRDFFTSLNSINMIRSSNIKTAEMAKIVQNIHRDVNIALANEISDVASELGIDFYELQKLVNTNPRVNLLSAGPGVGGYCLPNALGYLQPAFTGDKSCPLTLSEVARNLNKNRPSKVFNLISTALANVNKTTSESTIAIAGLAMKDYCADCRFSPAIDLINLLIEEKANVRAYDPLVPISYPFQTKTLDECIQGADCLVIVAKQRELSYPSEKLISLMNKPVIVVDTRNVINPSSYIHVCKL